MKHFFWIAVALIVVLLLMAVFTAGRPETFVVGQALPPGKIQPQVVAIWDRAYLLAPDGSLWAWGGTQYGSADIQLPRRSEIPRQIGTNRDWMKFSAGISHVLAIKSDHSLWGWGHNIWGELGASPASNGIPVRIDLGNDWQEVSLGNHHNLALKTNGSLWAWGLNREGQVGDPARTNWFSPQEILPGSRWRAISARGFNSYALRDDGTIWRWGFSTLPGNPKHDFEPRQIGDGTNWVAISAGDYHLLALNRDGSVWVHGPNAHLVAPHHTMSSVGGFAQLGSDYDWSEVHSGANYVTLRKADGSWWISGWLGKTHHDTPDRIEWTMDPWAFSSSGNTTILLAKDGGLWTWGDRLGSKQPRNIAKEALVWLLGQMSGSRSASPIGPIVDNEPHRVWNLPEQTNHPVANRP